MWGDRRASLEFSGISRAYQAICRSGLGPICAVGLSLAQVGCGGGDPESHAFSADVVLGTFRTDQGLHVADDVVSVDLGTFEHRIVARATDFVWSPDRQRILFERERHLFVAPAVAGDAVQVAEDTSLEYSEGKDWSPDSSQIAFIHASRLFAARPDGRNTIELSKGPADPVSVSGWQWAPTGAHLVYESGLSLWLAGLDGAASQQLARPRDNLRWLADEGWSSDGLHFAYVSHSDSRIWVQDVGGGARAVGVRETPWQAFAWSPDGSRLAHSTANGVAITMADGSAVLELSSEPITPTLGQSFRWAPDGSRLVYRVGVQLWTSLPDGSDRRPLEGGSGIDTIYWAPDSSRLAFIVGTDAGSVLWMASRTGADARRVSPDPVVLACEWAPDATRIACLEQTPSEQRIRITLADGSGDLVLPATSPIMGFQWSPTSEFIAASIGDAPPIYTPTVWQVSLFAADGTSEIALDDQDRASGLWSSDGNWFVHTDGTLLHATNLRGERRVLGGSASRPLWRFAVR